MHISEARIDEATGGLIAAGTLQLIDVPGVTLPEHEHVLLIFEASQLLCRPLPAIERLGNGLYRVATSHVEVRLFGMNVEQFNTVIPNGAEPLAGRSSFTGPKVGMLAEPRAYEFQHCSVQQAITADGMTVSVDAELSDRVHVGALRHPGREGRVHLRATLNWATMRVRGLKWSGLAAKYEPPATIPGMPIVETPTAELRLEDLRLTGGVDDLLAPGHITLLGPGERTVIAAPQMVSLRWLGPHASWDRPEMIFRDCERAELGHDGFCSTHGSDYWLQILGLDFRLIEDLLCKAVATTVVMRGGDFGRISLDTGIPGGGHGGNRVSQPMTTATVFAELKADGLRLKLEADLGPYPQRTLDEYTRRGQTVRTQPYDRLEVEITASWIWLLVYSPKLGVRHAEFAALSLG
jgi:hypothetical protein